MAPLTSSSQLALQGSGWAAQCASDVAHLTAALAGLPMSEGDKQETVARLQALRERRFILQASRLGASPHTRSSFDSAAALYYGNGARSDAPTDGTARPYNQLRAVDLVRSAPREAAQPLAQPPQPAQQLQEQLQLQGAGHREDIDPLHAAAGIGSSSPRVLRRYFTEGSGRQQGSPVLVAANGHLTSSLPQRGHAAQAAAQQTAVPPDPLSQASTPSDALQTAAVDGMTEPFRPTSPEPLKVNLHSSELQLTQQQDQAPFAEPAAGATCTALSDESVAEAQAAPDHHQLSNN